MLNFLSPWWQTKSLISYATNLRVWFSFISCDEFFFSSLHFVLLCQKCLNGIEQLLVISEGEKYELAKKIPKIKLVNHHWLEDW